MESGRERGEMRRLESVMMVDAEWVAMRERSMSWGKEGGGEEGWVVEEEVRRVVVRFVGV